MRSEPDNFGFWVLDWGMLWREGAVRSSKMQAASGERLVAAGFMPASCGDGRHRGGNGVYKENG
jgi:hypothetical protein